MNAFDIGRAVEARGMARLMPFLRENSNSYVLIENSRLADALQPKIGDVVYSGRQTGAMVAADFKIEQRFTGRAFIEIFSNLNLSDPASSAERGITVGWIFKLNSAGWIWFYWLDQDVLVVVNILALQRFVFGHAYPDGRKRIGAIWTAHDSGFGPLVQRQHAQRNDTHGLVVPIETLRKALGERLVRIVRGVSTLPLPGFENEVRRAVP